MTSRSVEPEAPPTAPGSDARPAPRPGPTDPIGRIMARVGALDRRIRRVPLVRAIQNVLDTYNAAGGGITASGLAYGALFAVIPGLLLVISILVIVVDNKAARDDVITWLVQQVPPIADFAAEIVKNLAESARVGTVVGLVGFIWGASGFYLGLEGAMQRSFPGPRRRDPIMGRIRGVIAVALVVGAILATFVVSTLVSFVPSELLVIVLAQPGRVQPHRQPLATHRDRE